MPEAICPACGAINQLRAEICWRCLESMDERPAAQVETPVAASAERHRAAS